MKQKLKKLKFLLAITLAAILLYGCQVEQELANTDLYMQNGVIMHKKFDDLIQEAQFKTAFDKLNPPKKGNSKKGNANSKTVMENENDFTIDNSILGNVITTDGIKSYTFLINRPVKQKNVFENLVINTKENLEPVAFIFTYDCSTNPVNNLIDFQNFKGKKSISLINYNPSTVATSKFTLCVTTYTWVCPNHSEYEPGCTGHGFYGEETCFSAPSGPSNPYVIGMNNNPTNTPINSTLTQGGGLSPPTIPVIVNAPVLPAITLEDPCEILKPLLAEPAITTAITNSQPRTQSNAEAGYEVSKGWGGPNNNTPDVVTTQFVAGSQFSVDLQVGGAISGGIHNHPIDGGAYPSWGDVKWLLSCENNNSPSKEGTAFAIVVVADPQNAGSSITYAITIGNLAALRAQIDADMAIPKVAAMTVPRKQLDYFLDKQAKAFQPTEGNTAQSEVKFLQYFNNYGINLSKLDPTTNKWNTLNLATPFNPKRPNAANSIVPTPCN